MRKSEERAIPMWVRAVRHFNDLSRDVRAWIMDPGLLIIIALVFGAASIISIWLITFVVAGIMGYWSTPVRETPLFVWVPGLALVGGFWLLRLAIWLERRWTKQNWR